ncbi:MAG: cyclase family protein [Chloroflexi bacterium]|nr:MAG: cyclase family protein [Chloroflexota bacterium]MBL1193290.1 cyclase family protein [Chloroflexota bacterium]NOH10582.1 cyclase family protein [Chloroflexota bacterium]
MVARSEEKRVVFDFEVDFSNGGGIQGQGFRLDIDGDDILDKALADYIVEDMRLLMVGEVRILNKKVITEKHKRAEQGDALSQGTTLINLSHTIEDGLITYKGLPAPIICDYLSREESRAHYSEGTEFHIGKIEMVANTGTYIDSPFHRFAEGMDIADLPLSSVADLEGVVVWADPDARAVTKAAFEDIDIWGKAVLVHTGWDRHWKTDQYFEGHPFLTEDAAEFLKKAGAKLVGIDSLNIDDTEDGRRPVHTTLLGADIPVVEHMCGLEHLPDAGFRFFAVPAKVQGMGTFPIQAFAIVNS